MGFAEVQAQAAEDILTHMGASATFTPSEGDAVTCNVFVEKNVEMEPAGYEARAWETGTTILAVLDVLGKEPDSGETFEVGDDTYTVKRVLENDGVFVKVAVK